MTAAAAKLRTLTFPGNAGPPFKSASDAGWLANYASVPASVSLSSSTGVIASPSLAAAVRGSPVAPFTFALEKLRPNSNLVADFGAASSWFVTFTPPADVSGLWLDLYLNAAVISDQTGTVRILAFI